MENTQAQEKMGEEVQVVPIVMPIMTEKFIKGITYVRNGVK